MSIHPAIYAKLKPLCNGNVYPILAPQGAPYPNITYLVTSSDHNHHLLATNGLAAFEVQIDCWANDSETATATSDLCRKLIDNNRIVYWGNTKVFQVWVKSMPDSYEPTEDGTEMALFRATLMATVWAEEPIY